MSLYGALFTGVSGLQGQGQKIASISDNIANVNTVGYKRAESQFSTLVVNATSQTAYSPGGVQTGTRYNIDQQGQLSSTTAPTDVAISGSGLFVVSGEATGAEQIFFTRAGSFRQDENGDFVNAQGFYLRAWPLDRNGLLPGEPGNSNTVSFSNIESLEAVNVESASGVAEATEEIELGINLDAGEEIFQGEGVIVNMDSNSTNNYQISGDDIIVPDETSAVIPPPSFGLATTNNIARGDQFTINTGNGLSYDYEYGGFSIGRDITATGTANIGDGQNDLTPTSLAGGAVVVANASNLFTVTSAAHGLATGDEILVDDFTFAAAGNVPLSEINAVHTVTVLGANTFTFSTTTNNTGGADVNAAAPVTTWTTRLFTGNILDATAATQPLIDPATLSDYTVNARSFTIATTNGGTRTFTYTSGSPSAVAGQFNSLNSLATAIAEQPGLTARVVDGRLVVGAKDATEAVTFANVDDVGSGALRGIDWVTELDLLDVASASRRFSTLNGLADLVNDDDGVSAIVNNPLGEATMEIYVDDPLDTIQLEDWVDPNPTALAVGSVVATVAGPPTATVQITLNAHGLSVGDNIVLSNLSAFDGFTTTEINGTFTVVTVPTANTFTISVTTAAGAIGAGNTDGDIAYTNVGSLVREFGLTADDGTSLGTGVASLAGGTYVRGDTGDLGPKYDSSGLVGENMASGDIEAQFTRSVRIFDALGTGHDINYSFIKIAQNEWAVEIFSVPEDDISTSLVDGQVAVGTVSFNGDGSLRNVSTSLSDPITINWTNGADPSEVTIDWGSAGLPFGTAGATEIGDTDGMRQFDGDYKVFFTNQDGSPTGELVSVSIDEEGYVIASFTNGDNQRLYKIPIADFTNPNGLRPVSGNVYAQTVDSGDLILREAGDNGVGKVVAGALEQSNVDLAQELTDMIVAQRAYQSNTRVISTTDELLDRLNQL